MSVLKSATGPKGRDSQLSRCEFRHTLFNQLPSCIRRDEQASPTKRAIVLHFFRLTDRPQPEGARSKACALRVIIERPDKYRHALASASWHGWAPLNGGVGLRFYARVFIEREADPARRCPRRRGVAEGRICVRTDEGPELERASSPSVTLAGGPTNF